MDQNGGWLLFMLSPSPDSPRKSVLGIHEFSPPQLNWIHFTFSFKFVFVAGDSFSLSEKGIMGFFLLFSFPGYVDSKVIVCLRKEMRNRTSASPQKYVLRRVDVYVCQKAIGRVAIVIRRMWLVFHANAGCSPVSRPGTDFSLSL
jgi:hypothetical protein